jgi:hypothetical protein
MILVHLRAPLEGESQLPSMFTNQLTVTGAAVLTAPLPGLLTPVTKLVAYQTSRGELVRANSEVIK